MSEHVLTMLSDDERAMIIHALHTAAENYEENTRVLREEVLTSNAFAGYETIVWLAGRFESQARQARVLAQFIENHERIALLND